MKHCIHLTLIILYNSKTILFDRQKNVKEPSYPKFGMIKQNKKGKEIKIRPNVQMYNHNVHMNIDIFLPT